VKVTMIVDMVHDVGWMDVQGHEVEPKWNQGLYKSYCRPNQMS